MYGVGDDMYEPGGLSLDERNRIDESGIDGDELGTEASRFRSTAFIASAELIRVKTWSKS